MDAEASTPVGVLGSVDLWRKAALALQRHLEDLWPGDRETQRKALAVARVDTGAVSTLEMTPEQMATACDRLSAIKASGKPPADVRAPRPGGDFGPFADKARAAVWAWAQTPCPFRHEKHATNALIKFVRELREGAGLRDEEIGNRWIEEVARRQRETIRERLIAEMRDNGQ